MKSRPKRVRIHSHVTQSKFLHVEDSLGFGQGKIRLFAGAYRRNQGMGDHAHHFLDLPDARVVFDALARGEQGFEHKEYKGTPSQNREPSISRVLSVKVKGQNVYIELKTGPGKLTKTGAITPNGRAEVEINVGFKLAEARRMAASVLAYIRAWDVMRIMIHQEQASKPSPYLLSPTTEETPIPSSPLPPCSASAIVSPSNGRPVTRKTTGKTNRAKQNGDARVLNGVDRQQNGDGKKEKNGNGRLSVKANESPVNRLFYGDGVMVSPENQKERAAYARYREAKGIVPPSKAELQAFYREQAQPV